MLEIELLFTILEEKEANKIRITNISIN